jgi:putative transposase
MPYGLKRFQQTGHAHFVTFSCYHRHRHLNTPEACDTFVRCLEQTRRRFGLTIYAYVVMPEHVHLLVSEPERGELDAAIRALKLAVSKRMKPRDFDGPFRFWQSRYYDRNIRNNEEFGRKRQYTHRNPVKRGLCASPEDWPWSSFLHYATGAESVVEIESQWTARKREREEQQKAPR